MLSLSIAALASSSMAGKTLRDFGYQTVYAAGGFKELADNGVATEPGD
jgi:hypothetical protein